MPNFTPEQLIAFHYNDLAADEHNAIQNELRQNWPLHEKYQVIREAALRLDKAMLQPRSSVVAAILNHGAAKMSCALHDN